MQRQIRFYSVSTDAQISGTGNSFEIPYEAVNNPSFVFVTAAPAVGDAFTTTVFTGTAFEELFTTVSVNVYESDGSTLATLGTLTLKNDAGYEWTVDNGEEVTFIIVILQSNIWLKALTGIMM